MAELALGSVVAGCRIEAIIGRGGMGLVYRATQLSLERPVALKAIAPELAGDASFRERFKRESRIAASIEHPNVIPVYEAGEGDGVLYLIMRYVEGTDLRALIAREGGLEPTRAARLVAQVASGLAAAHRRGLVHRDVKPANVLVDSDDGRDHAYLTDFGIARHVAATSGLTRTGAVVGTLDYLAPERIQGEGGDEAGADVYALGCVLYETLTGSVPYPRDNEVAKMYAHLNAPVPEARELVPSVPAELDEIALRAMAKQPTDRFATAAELADALTDAAPTPRPPPAAPPPPVVEELTETEQPAPEPTTPIPSALPAGLTDEPMLEAETGPELSLAERRADPTETVTRPAVLPASETTVQLPEPTVTRDASPPRHRGPVLAVAAGLLVVAAGIAVVLALNGGGGDPQEPIVQVSEPIKLDGEPDGVAVGAGRVWVADRKGGRVWAVDPATGKAQAHPVGANPDSVAIGAGSVWVTNTDDDNVTRLDANGGFQAEIDVGSQPEGIAYADGAAWVANSGDGTVTRIDGDNVPTSIRVGARGSAPIQLAFGLRRIWVTLSEGDERGIAAIDPKRGQRTRLIRLSGWRPRGIAFDPTERQLWVSSPERNMLVVVDPRKERSERGSVRVQQGPREVRYGMGSIWVTSARQGFVTAIDPTTREKLGEAKVGGTPFGLDVNSSKAWVGSLDPGLLTPFRLR